MIYQAMKSCFTRLVVLLAVASCGIQGLCQDSVVYPFNPDYDADGYVGVADVLGFLSYFDTPALIQTCWKGELCWIGAPAASVGESYAPANCGTIIGKAHGATSEHTIYLSNEGMAPGNVVHLVSYNTSGSASTSRKVIFRNEIDESHIMTLTRAYPEDAIGRAIFDGAKWIALDIGPGSTD